MGGKPLPPPPRGQVNIFISPAGEPFRAGADAPYPIDVWFSRADANHDGALSLEEFQADARTFFDRLDRNHDGVIDGFELSDYEQTVAPEILPRIARLGPNDIPPLPGEVGHKQGGAQPFALSRPGRGGRSGPGGAGAFSLTHEPEPVAAADVDFDSKVTRAEFLALSQRHFQQLDLNHDGRLERAELPPTEAQKLADRAAKEEAKGGGGERRNHK